MNPEYTNLFNNRIWSDVNGVPTKVTDMTDNHLAYVINLLQKDLNRIVNGFKAKDWLPIMLTEYAVRRNTIVKSAAKALWYANQSVPFPAIWNQPEPIMIRPSEREYDQPPLVEYSETIYGKYHCVVELDLNGYRFGYVGVRENHPAYKQDAKAISTFVHGGIVHTTHQVAAFRSSYLKMWYFAISFNHEEDYPDIKALDKYKEYWAGTHSYPLIEDRIKQNEISPGLLRGQGYFTVKDLDYVKEQLVLLVLDLEQYEKEEKAKATMVVAPF